MNLRLLRTLLILAFVSIAAVGQSVYATDTPLLSETEKEIELRKIELFQGHCDERIKQQSQEVSSVILNDQARRSAVITDHSCLFSNIPKDFFIFSSKSCIHSPPCCYSPFC
ncbi:MAG: hypothetical protein JXD21_07395 [Candidatus Omnitrophica bacterium]|nr:hypothetical protein [Candidatus Omnitrophota bacterium]